MKRDSFFDRTKEWSQRKHRLLAKYLKPFTAKLGSWNPTVYCIDGFAGVGKYSDNRDGSPLIMAQLADESASWGKPVNLKIINVEAKRAHFQELCQHTKTWSDQGIVKNIPGKFNKLVPDILSQINTAPAFFFVDPYGPTKIPFCDLLPILKRSVRATELIINFDADGLRRLGDRIHKNVSTERGLKGALTTIALVTKILGTDFWEEKFETGELSSQERDDLLLETYVRNLRRYEYSVVAYPVREAIGKAPKYYLLYCTRHSDGISLMNDFICEEEDQMIEESTAIPLGKTGSLFSIFDSVQTKENERRERLRTLILEGFRETKTTTRGKIKKRLKHIEFGKFHEKDYNAVVKGLIDGGILKTGNGRKQINDDIELTLLKS